MLELENLALSNSAKLVQLMLLLAFGYTIGTFQRTGHSRLPGRKRNKKLITK